MHATFIILYLNFLGLFLDGWRKQILPLLSFLGFLPKSNTTSNLFCPLQDSPEDKAGWLLALLCDYSNKYYVLRRLLRTAWEVL